MKKILILIAIIFFTGYSFAQQQAIRGKVVNENEEAVANASVYLLTATAKGVLKTTITNESGEYTFLDYPNGKMLIETGGLGYEKVSSDEFVGEGNLLVIPTIKLTKRQQEIAAVSVTGQLPVIQSKNGKLVMNVENSAISAGNNALEVLKRAPGVNVDKDDNISLMGQQGVNVTIDGRQTYMTGEQLATFLKSTDGSQIKNIELTTTRSAKDDAEGAAGVINIVMKKNKIEGFNGSLIASGAYGKKARGNSSINLNYKKNNTTLFSNYSYTNNSTIQDFQLQRTIPNTVGNTVFDQDADMKSHDVIHAYKVGVEQKTSERNTIMLQFNGSNNPEKTKSFNRTLMGPTLGVVDSILDANTNALEKFNRYSFNVNNEFKIDTTGRKLSADLDYSYFKTDANTNFNYETFFPDFTYKYPTELERNFIGVNIKILSAKVDYSQSLWKGVFEAGLKYSDVKSDNEIEFFNFLNNKWVNNAKRSNTFVYDEQITAGYVDYARNLGKWDYKVGLRAEYTLSDGHSITESKRVKRDYLDLFPSAAINYSFNENHVLSLSYARKITRPNYRFLNPFEYYIDKRTFNKGNPYLNPQYTNGVSLNYSLYKMFNIALGYDLVKDAIVESMGQDKELKTAWVTRENLGEQQTTYLNLTIPIKVGIWTMYNNVTGIYLHFKGPVSGHYVSQGSAFVQGNTTNTFRILKQLNAEMSVRYNSKFLYNIYEIQSRASVDLGASYNFSDKRSSLKFAFTDIFHSDHNNVFTNFNEFNSKIFQYRDSQTFRLTFNYKFGNLKQSVNRRDSSSDEKQRAL